MYFQQQSLRLMAVCHYDTCKSLLHVHAHLINNSYIYRYLSTLLDGACCIYYITSNMARFVSQTNDSILVVKASHMDMYMYILTVSYTGILKRY